jgi:hypothetical protein
MRAASAAAFPATHLLLSVRDGRTTRRIRAFELRAVPVQQETAHEDHQPPEVVLVQRADGSDQLSVDSHVETYVALYLRQAHIEQATTQGLGDQAPDAWAPEELPDQPSRPGRIGVTGGGTTRRSSFFHPIGTARRSAWAAHRSYAAG